MDKWLLSYDPEIESHPWTLVKVDVYSLQLKEAIQFTSPENALAAIKDPDVLTGWKVDDGTP